MSVFKRWGKKSKNKEKTKENSDKAEDNDIEHEFDLPPSVSRDRNMSISRSGRHKVKKQNRASIVSGDIYTSDGATSRQQASAPGTYMGWTRDYQKQTPSSSNMMSTASDPNRGYAQSSKPPSGHSGSYHCRETVDPSTSKLSGSQRMASAPTAV